MYVAFQKLQQLGFVTESGAGGVMVSNLGKAAVASVMDPNDAMVRGSNQVDLHRHLFIQFSILPLYVNVKSIVCV